MVTDNPSSEFLHPNPEWISSWLKNNFQQTLELKRIALGFFLRRTKSQWHGDSLPLKTLERIKYKANISISSGPPRPKAKGFLFSLPAKYVNLKIFRNCNLQADTIWRGNYSSNFFERPQKKSKMKPESPIAYSLKKNCGSLKLLDLKQIQIQIEQEMNKFSPSDLLTDSVDLRLYDSFKQLEVYLYV